jgi:hypothetical protein
MTGKNVVGQGSWNKINTSFTKAQNELFVEDINPTKVTGPADVRARSWTEVAGGILNGAGKAAAGVIKNVGKRYRNGVYARTYNIGAIDAPKYTTSNSADIPYVVAKPAKQPWLQKITKNIGRYVFGATVTEGNKEAIKEGIYIDEGLDRDEKKYNFYFDNSLFEDAKEYATRAWEAVKTKFHEWGHYALKINSEYGAERYAVEAADKLAAVDGRAAFAKKYATAA